MKFFSVVFVYFSWLYVIKDILLECFLFLYLHIIISVFLNDSVLLVYIYYEVFVCIICIGVLCLTCFQLWVFSIKVEYCCLLNNFVSCCVSVVVLSCYSIFLNFFINIIGFLIIVFWIRYCVEIFSIFVVLFLSQAFGFVLIFKLYITRVYFPLFHYVYKFYVMYYVFVVLML